MLELKRIYWTRQLLRLAMAALTVWIFAAAILSFVARSGNVAAGRRPNAVTAIFTEMFDGVLAASALTGVLAVVLIIVAVVIQARDVKRRDPVRRFSRQQRREGMARAAGQCEMEAGFRRRCSRPAEHGDHFYPWSKGGSTSLQNFVAACSRCNRAKGAQIPSPAQQERLERRRRDYVALDGAVSVGERLPLP
ncbi:HNH endonuclease [Arthrobacter sp. Soil736]|uniref:HNH endonuclease n=1 Tax=Arthrobacter sp. Soil736 TaxID=1736395 RepID=UPI0006FD80BE|nr:HNH endonuclease signature motif containing protein [Arthrobacter sp. Soil736]KRE57751.1 HNH endonuclease [Arthrobacter sp. Soil736]